MSRTGGGMFLAALQERNQRSKPSASVVLPPVCVETPTQEPTQTPTQTLPPKETEDTFEDLPSHLSVEPSPSPPLPTATNNNNGLVHGRISRSLGSMDSSSDGSEATLLNHTSSLGGVLRHRRPSMAEHGGGGMRERSPSQTNVETMYSRAGKELSRFEFTNPSFPDSAHSRPRAPSQAEQQLDSQRIDSLLHSSAKFDSTVLMERRTRRATSVIARPYEAQVAAMHEKEEEQNE
ncbi:hypothetical protein BASA81_001203 [Batrachochytrium salamandrivorans]|nr:hypothetical protein BASA81_001203 [Batrachochytrium salamandrivorans]